MMGAIFIIESIELLKDQIGQTSPVKGGCKEDTECEQEEEKKHDTYGPFNGQVIATVKDLCKKSFLNAEPRVVEGMNSLSK